MGKRIKIRRRFFRVARIFFRMFYDFSREYRLVRKKGYQYAQKKMQKIHAKRARELYQVAVNLEGVLIKLCQYFSARRDVFPDQYIRTLTPLQDSVPALDFNVIQKVIREEYGDYEKHFSSIDARPLASASLGQIHRAKFHDGTEVVLKILKPGIEKIIDIDFAILSQVFAILSHFRFFRENADFIKILDEFISVTGDELNFRREAWLAIEFKKGLARFQYLTIPHIYQELCTSRIIVMEYCPGDRINQMDRWTERNNDPEVISRRLVEIYIEMFLDMSLIHFDPHPGNILITDDNRMVLIDFGMAGEISGTMRKGIADFLEAFVKRDYRKIVDTLFVLGFIRKDFNRYQLLPVVEYFFGELMDVMKLERESMYTVDLTPIKDNLVDIMYSQPFNIPYEWTYIGKTLSTIAGLISQLNSDFKLYDELKPYIERFLKENAGEMVKRTLNNLKTNFEILSAMPVRIDNFIDNVEQGYLKIRMDYTEITEKIDEVKVFAIRVISFILSLFSGISAYVFWNRNETEASIMFIGVGALSFFWSLLYRKKSAREKLKRFF